MRKKLKNKFPKEKENYFSFLIHLHIKCSYKKQQIPAATNTDLKAIAGHYFSNELNMDFQLLLNEQHKLQIKFSNRDRVRSVVALNRSELLASNFRMKIIRNQLDEITDILITLNDRAKNNRFNRKKLN